MTWLEFKDAVKTFLTVDADRVGTENFVEEMIRQAVIDIQSYVDIYRERHETTYTVDEVDLYGEASHGDLPEKAQIRDVFYQRQGYDYQCIRQPVYEYPWDNRFDLVCGNMGTCQYALTIDPWARTFFLWPALEQGRELFITYDALKLDFEDGDSVPFDEQMAAVASEFVLAKIERRVNKDIAMHDSYMRGYERGRRRLYIDAQDRKRFRNNNPSPQTNGSNCVSCDVESTDTTVGDSFLTANTLEELRALPSLATNSICILLGYEAAYDQRATVYAWDPSGTDADNYALVVRPDDFSVSGVWRQML